MAAFPDAHVLLALLRDGFHPESAGGNVGLRDDGSPVLAYPLTPFIWDGVRRALLADGGDPVRRGRARACYPVHERGDRLRDPGRGARGHRRAAARAAC